MSRPTVEQVARALAEGSPILWSNMKKPTRDVYRDQARIAIALFEPETVTTPAELDALPVGSAVLDSDGDAWQMREKSRIVGGEWRAAIPEFAAGDLRATKEVALYLPITVIHRGGDQ